MRRIVLNEDYTGATGYPRLVEPDRWRRIVEGVARMDPVAVQARRGGRRPAEFYLLRGVSFCGRCGSAMYTLAAGRFYLCGAVREARGTCDLPRIPAGPVEAYVLNHLREFRLDVAHWLDERAAEGRVERGALERTAAGLRSEVARVEQRITATRREHDRFLDAGEDDVAATAMREIARYESEREAAAGRLAAADPRVGVDRRPRPRPGAGSVQRHRRLHRRAPLARRGHR